MGPLAMTVDVNDAPTAGKPPNQLSVDASH